MIFYGWLKRDRGKFPRSCFGAWIVLKFDWKLWKFAIEIKSHSFKKFLKKFTKHVFLSFKRLGMPAWNVFGHLLASFKQNSLFWLPRSCIQS